MSQATAVRSAPRPATRPAARAAAPPRLRVVGAPAQARSRAGLVLGCLLLLGLGLVGLLLLNVSLERGAYTLHAQQAQVNRLQEQEQALQEVLASLEAPQNLAVQAGKLGMVPNPNAAFIRPSDGKVLGVPTRAVAPPTPSVTGTATASPGGGAGPTKAPAPSPTH